MRRYALCSRDDRRVSLITGWLAAGLIVLSGALANAQTPAVRTWTSGEYKIEAKFVSVADGVVTLEKADGEALEIELKNLSTADQSYVTQQQKAAAANPFRKKAANPFKKATGAGRNTGSDESGESPPSGRLVKPNWNGVPSIVATPTSTGWKVPVSTEEVSAPPPKLRPVPIPPKGDFFEGSKAVAINASGTRAVAGYAGAKPGMNQKGASQIALCDLENGKLLGAGRQVGLYAPLALSDDGSQVLMRTDVFGPAGHDRLEFWSLAGKSGVVKGDQWVPYESVNGANGGDRDVRWAAYLDPRRFATISEAGHLVIWETTPLKPLATFKVEKGCTPALSPDRKLLAFATPKDIGVLDLASLDVIAVQPAPMPNMAWTAFTFSPTGKRLACKVFVNKVFVYDVAEGNLYREISLQGLNVQQTPAVFSDDDHLILGDHTVVDLESQVRLWQYQGNERVVSSQGVCWFEVAANLNQAGALIPAQVPPPGAQEALAKAARDPNFFIFKPGVTVSIDVNGIPDASQRPSVLQSLTANLAKNGVKVAAGSPVTVVASLEQGKEQEIAYRSFGAGRQVERFKVRPWMSRLKIVYEGKAAWDSGASSMPHFEMTRLQKDESLQDHVKKFELPNYKYFANAELPKMLTRPTGQNAGVLGTSQVSLSGIR